tara:strand:+ start:829 stop:2505 length:1677 start_codon:yes stop_codon:yes gene_type:complete
MSLKKIIFIFIFILSYQSTQFSKSASFDSKNVSKYFSGIVAFDNKNNSEALNFFNSSKILLNKHDPYLKRYVYSLVLENKIPQAINTIKINKDKKNSDFFEAYLLLILDSLKKSDFNKAQDYLLETIELFQDERFNSAILQTLRNYIYVFQENKILNNKKTFGNFSIISETFQRCYLGDKSTEMYFKNLINDLSTDYSRYIYFYLSYLIENKRFKESENIVNEINYINSSLLLSQGKNWIENGEAKKLTQVFSCKNHNDVTAEFFFLISNLYSSQDDFKESNFYLNLSIFLNPKFVFNLSLVAENQYLNLEFNEAKKTLENFQAEDDFYYWYRVKKESQIIAKQKTKKESLDHITTEFKKFKKPNNKFLFDVANFYKNSKEYEKAIEYYSKIIETLGETPEIKADLLYRRGGTYERMQNYKKADEDLIHSLKLNPDDAYVLNYLAYSWLERDFKINEAIKMLEKAYALEDEDPYIIDSIGWAYYLINDFIKAERFLKRAVELMPDDPIVNDHYGDILWKLNRKIQARYFWTNVLKMEDAEVKMLEKINTKLVVGLEES